MDSSRDSGGNGPMKLQQPLVLPKRC